MTFGRADAPPPRKHPHPDLLAAAGLLLTLTLFFPETFLTLGTRLVLSMDTANIFYPVHEWAHASLKAGRLPLMSDLAGHGTPMAGTSVLGLLSPAVWAAHLLAPSPLAAYQALGLLPFASLLIGSFLLGRELSLSRSASVLLALLWTYHGKNMTHPYHVNLLAAGAFLPWILLALARATRHGGAFRSAGAGLFLGLALVSGHPQMAWMILCFIPFVLYGLLPGTTAEKTRHFGITLLFAALFSAPFVLHAAESLFFDRPDLAWSVSDLYYHSWTPLNLVTLLFPFFFGHTAMDGTSSYWWQYQFQEMHFFLSVAGLLFALLFLTHRGKGRWVLLAATFLFLYLSMGKFSLLYKASLHLPVAGAFRDPARWGFPAAWILGLAAALGWDRWSTGRETSIRRLGTGLWGLALAIVGAVALLTGPLRHRLEGLAMGLAERWILADPTHPHQAGLSHLLERLPAKMTALSLNADPANPAVFLPLLLLAATLAFVWKSPRERPGRQVLLLLLVLFDLWAFRTRAGDSWKDMRTLPGCRVPPSEGLLLSHVSGTTRPSLDTARAMAYPDSNLPLDRRTLDVVLGASLPRYGEISKRLGWFSWVYRERKPFGFLDHPNLLRALGVDLCVSDVPIPEKAPFGAASRKFPYSVRLEGARPRAVLVKGVFEAKWPDLLDLIEDPFFRVGLGTFVEPGTPRESLPGILDPLGPLPVVKEWSDTQVIVETGSPGRSFLILQKSFLPAWKAIVNGQPVPTLRCDGVLLGVPLPAGPCRVEMTWRPGGLRFGFFLALLGSAFLAFLAIGRYSLSRGPNTPTMPPSRRRREGR